MATKEPKRYLRIQTNLSPKIPPGSEVAARVGPGFGAGSVASRDLNRYYTLLKWALPNLQGRFTTAELEVLAQALKDLSSSGSAELIRHAPAIVEDWVRLRNVCGRGALEDCEGFLSRVKGLDMLGRYALVDAIGRYFLLPEGERGEVGWKRVGLLP